MTIDYGFDALDESEEDSPYGENDLRTREIFEQRKKYKDKYEDYSQVAPIDLNGKRKFYGRVDHQKNSITPRTKKRTSYTDKDGRERVGNINIMKSFRNDTTDETYFAMNFVVDAFLSFRNYYRAARLRGAVVMDKNEALFNLEPVAGWENPNEAYDIYLREFGEKMLERSLRQNVAYTSTNKYKRDIVTFSDFINFFYDDYLDTASPEIIPMSKCQFVRSADLTVMHTGLAIQIADDDQSDDAFKYDNYLTDENFDFYTAAALRYGFRVDVNAPWRLVADLSSPYMISKMKEYNISTARHLFGEYYKKSYLEDLNNIREFFFVYYDRLLEIQPTTTITRAKRKGSVSKLVDRKPITEEKFLLDFPLVFWYDMYAQLRMKEMNMFNKESYDKIRSTIQKYGNTLDIEAIIGYINRQIVSCM
tara:strand:+ start:2897 stop:4159 length:1263 start_codon:yes stop_codon:yes gene_type:complete